MLAKYVEKLMVQAMSSVKTAYSTIEEALEDIVAGKMVVVVDDEDRENEGDLVMAAQFVTPEAINFMTRQAGGWICLALTPDRCDELGLELMAAKNESPHQTPFTVTIEARAGRDDRHQRPRPGAHDADRDRPDEGPDEIVKPGHVRPLKAKPGGVLERAGHTEASVDLARLAGLNPAGVICEIQNDDGSMARGEDLARVLPEAPPEDDHDRRPDRLPPPAREAGRAGRLDAPADRRSETSDAVGYRSLVDNKHHVALVKGNVEGQDDVLVRVHSECLTGDVFHSLRCDCGEQLESALSMIESEGERRAAVPEPGRARDRAAEQAPGLQAPGGGPRHGRRQPALGLPADLRDYGIGAQILVDLGLTSIRILTNNPKKISGLAGYGLSVTDQIPIQHVPNPHNEAYLRAKRDRLGHTLHHQGLALDEEMLHGEQEHDRRRRESQPG